MREELLILRASAIAGCIAAALIVRKSSPAWGAYSAGLGFIVGSLFIGTQLDIPPRTDQGRLIFVLVPAVIVSESFAAASPRFGWFWRSIIAAVASPILLWNSIYVADLAGPDSRQWSPGATALIMIGLGAALAVSWVAVDGLAARASRTTPFAIALVIAGAGMVVMLSGYASGGQLGFPLTAAIIGTAAIGSNSATNGTVGIGVVGLFALLVIGRYFGFVTLANCLLLFIAPVMGWFAELPALRRWRSLAGIVLPLIPASIAVYQAWRDY